MMMKSRDRLSGNEDNDGPESAVAWLHINLSTWGCSSSDQVIDSNQFMSPNVLQDDTWSS